LIEDELEDELEEEPEDDPVDEALHSIETFKPCGGGAKALM
jgi:hypothetical protein